MKLQILPCVSKIFEPNNILCCVSAMEEGECHETFVDSTKALFG